MPVIISAPDIIFALDAGCW